jgi:hypothetical protein
MPLRISRAAQLDRRILNAQQEGAAIDAGTIRSAGQVTADPD